MAKGQSDVDLTSFRATTAMAKSSGRLVMETLNVSGMMLNRRLALAAADAGMSGFVSKLEYKRPWHGAG